MKTEPLAESSTPERALCLFSDDFPELRLKLQRLAEAGEGLRLVCLEFDRIPDVRALTDALLDGLAQSLLCLWPEWYGTDIGFERPADFPGIANRICREQPHVHRAWLAAAASACREGRPPLFAQFTAAVQARQLRLALSIQRLVVAVFASDTDPPGERLLGLSRGAEWLAREAGACVVVVCPTELSPRRELDSINSQVSGWALSGLGERAGDTGSTKSRTTITETPPPSVAERKHLVCPILGRPHPASPGEQLLAERLAADDALRELFGFNQRLVTVFDSRFIVDLLWAAGRVVVEIDGYGWHSTRSAFNADRERDYELTLSGYLVLRLPHDLVVQDPQLACERIREFVSFRQKQLQL